MRPRRAPMPELPEVEVTRRGLAPELSGRRITGVIVRDARLRWPVPDTVRRLTGRILGTVRRRGKYLLIACGNGTLIVHLGMSGSLRLVPAGTPVGKHDHFEVQIGARVLRLRDPRRFGAVLWTTDPPEAHRLLAHLGIEPLSRAFDGAMLHTRTRAHRTAIKSFLMDARHVVGVGNIYASESLFLAGIHPRTAAGRLSRVRCDRLVHAVRDTLRRAIRAGGSSLRDFVASDGREGYFQMDAWVYDRSGMPCRRCGAIVRRIVQGQRSTYYCPACQH